jgi:hypothetical protein
MTKIEPESTSQTGGASENANTSWHRHRWGHVLVGSNFLEDLLLAVLPLLRSMTLAVPGNEYSEWDDKWDMLSRRRRELKRLTGRVSLVPASVPCPCPALFDLIMHVLMTDAQLAETSSAGGVV